MKIFHSTILALAIGATSVSTVYARDSFSLGINIGGYGYAPPVVYYAAPPVVYYSEPIVYYRSAPQVYYQPLVSYRYYDGGYRNHYRGWGHEGREHHGWGHGGRNRGGHDRHEGHH